MKVNIIDAMAEVQCLDKPDWVKNCVQLVDDFVNTIEQIYGRKTCLILDRYDETNVVEKSKRGRGKEARHCLLSDHRFFLHLKLSDKEASVTH